MKFSSLAVRVCAVWLLALALVSPAWGQAGSSTIRGTVTDPQGAVVPRAKVSVTNQATNLTRSQETTATGTFSFELLPPGTYRVEIRAEGFRAKFLNNVQALVGLPTIASAQLEVGNIAETVEVEATATATQVNTQDATIGNNFVSQQITQLPLEARNPQVLLTLQPGVTGSPNAAGYVAGARSDQSNITLDGVDINEAQTNSLSDPVLRLSSEAIEEFRVTTVNANANQGRSSAAQINLVTKSGTNQFHGAAFYYNRSTGFTANDFFNNRSGLPRAALIRNLFGGSLGGPVIKDKVFFFYSYEGLTDASATSVARLVPLPHLGQGQIRYRDASGTVQTLTMADLNASFPEAQINPVAVAALADAAAKYCIPTPPNQCNDNTQGDNLNTGGFRFNAPIRRDNNLNVGKVDWNINDKQTLFVRAQFDYDLSGQVPNFPDTPAPNTWQHPWGGVVSHNWTFGRNWVNSFRYGYTRQAFSQQGDSAANNISFRFIFSPRLFQRELARKTPVHNIVNDVSWIKNNHTIGFGTNIRLVGNSRLSFGNAYDTAVTNPTFYFSSGNTIVPPISAFLAANSRPAIRSADVISVRDSATALIGRLSQYSARFTFGADGSLLPAGSPSDRTFATQEYDVYLQDTWRVRRDLTLSLGLRYSISRPVYEKNGFEVKPDIAMDDYFKMRVAAAAQGVIFADPITLDLSGPANKRSSLYRWDRNNLQPRIAVAWTPSFENKMLKWFFGSQRKTVFRGGYAITNDYYGQALAVLFDLNNTLGFTSNQTPPANTYDISTANGVPLAPLFTGYDQQIRPLPLITPPTSVSFPKLQPSDRSRRIETGLDEGLVAPINYVWNFTIERELPKGFVVQANYTGRLGRNLLAQRDAMALNDLVDPQTGMDWYTAMGMLQKLRATFPQSCVASSNICGVPYNTIPTISYFENVFGPAALAALNPSLPPGATLSSLFGASYAGLNATQTLFRRIARIDASDTTFTQDRIDRFTRINFFYNPQYGALSTWGTLGNSNYQGASVTVRQRFRGLLWDLNYTFSHSFDDASGLQANGSFSGSAFFLNPIRQHDSYSVSNFDLRHQVNVSSVFEFPFGRGRYFGGSVNRGVDAFIGGWQLSGIFRWNTGLPANGPFDSGHWATNWNISSGMFLTRAVSTCVTKGSTTVSPKLFGCNEQAVYQSWRSPLPGEGRPRNLLRLPGYVNLDLGLSKFFTMPYNERHKVQLRWEVFNVTNTQRLGSIGGTTAHVIDPIVNNATAPANWFNLDSTQKPPGSTTAGRVMQVGARFSF